MKLRTLLRPGYVLRRLHYKLYELRHPGEPWIAQGAVKFVDQNLDPVRHVGLEWGSGRSTAWFAKRLKRLTSVEHNRAWYEKVATRLDDRGCSNVNYLYVPLDHPEEEPAQLSYEQTPAYVSVADQFDEGELDFVVVDGHYRLACILAALPKLKSGGLLLVDNTDWPCVDDWHVPKDWPVVHQSRNVMTQTTVWQKP